MRPVAPRCGRDGEDISVALVCLRADGAELVAGAAPPEVQLPGAEGQPQDAGYLIALVRAEGRVLLFVGGGWVVLRLGGGPGET